MTTESQKPSEQIAAKLPELRLEVAALMAAIGQYLDEEAERRAKSASGVQQRLDILERSQRDVLTRLPPVDHSALIGLVGDGAPPYEVPEWIKRAKPIACWVGMPEPQVRVLFFVPQRVTPERWQAGRFFRNGYDSQPRVAEWAGDESERHGQGRRRVTYRLDEVTHWMPLPGDPT